MPAATVSGRRSLQLTAACVGLAAAAFVLHWRALDGFWRIDDPYLLIRAFDIRAWEYFLSPQAWRSVSNAFLTPWVQIVFETNYAAFGLEPSWYYARALLAAGAAGAAMCLLVSLWTGVAWAALGGLLLVASSPVAMTVEQLNAAHYLDGLAFACLSAWLFVLALRRGSAWMAIGAALFFALATFSKESYVPLVGVLLFLPENGWRRRVTFALPVLGVAALYVPWRIWMLGTPWGGYTGGAEVMAPWPVVRGAAAFVIGTGVAGALAAVPVLIAGMAALRRGGVRGLVFLVVALVCLAVPLLPVINNLAVHAWPLATGRYLLPAWAMASAVIALGLGTLDACGRWGRAGAAVAALVVVAAVALQGRHAAATVEPWLQRADALGRFVWQAQEPARLWVDLDGLEHAVKSTITLRRLTTAREVPKLSLVSDEILLREQADAGSRVQGYDGDCRCVRALGGRLEEKLAGWAARRREMPLSVRMQTDGEVLRWEFGPWEEGRYQAVMADGSGRVPVPRSGELRLHDHDIALYVRYDSPEGWVTYSPLLRLDPKRAPEVSWSRAPAPDVPE